MLYTYDNAAMMVLKNISIEFTCVAFVEREIDRESVYFLHEFSELIELYTPFS